MGDLQWLERLNISRHPVASFPTFLNTLPKLKVLDIYFTNITCLHADLLQNPSVEKVYVNSMHKMYPNVPELHKIKYSNHGDILSAASQLLLSPS